MLMKKGIYDSYDAQRQRWMKFNTTILALTEVVKLILLSVINNQNLKKVFIPLKDQCQSKIVLSLFF